MFVMADVDYEMRVRRCYQVVRCPCCRRFVEHGHYAVWVTVLSPSTQGTQPLGIRRQCRQCHKYFIGACLYPSRLSAEEGLDIVRQLLLLGTRLRLVLTYSNPLPPPRKPVSLWPPP